MGGVRRVFTMSNKEPNNFNENRLNKETSVASKYTDEASLQASPLHHHIIGLSPQYSSFIPCLIQDINQLMLINGVDCIVAVENSSASLNFNESGIDVDGKRAKTDNNNPNNYHKVLPISKCILSGIISYAHAKANGSTQYVLDDGSGFIDCIAWEDSQSSLYSLPPIDNVKSDTLDYHHPGLAGRKGSKSAITGKRRRMEQKLKTEYAVGDCVKIYGRIRCISLLNQTMTVIRVPDGNWEGKKCVREISIISIQSVNEERFISDRSSTSESYDKAQSNIVTDTETLHWLRCLQFQKRLSLPSLPSIQYETSIPEEYLENEDEGYQYQQCHINQIPILNGAEIIDRMPLKMKSIILDPSSTEYTAPSIAASVPPDICAGEENNYMLSSYFGKSCKCTLANVKHKYDLMYCHCKASSETLDPLFIFRDALLSLLLKMESSRTLTQLDTTDDDTGHKCLTFSYEDISNESSLLNVADKVLPDRQDKSKKIRKLYTNTFHWLRQDGVVYLLDFTKDTYLFISKKFVLIPCLRDFMKNETSWEIMSEESTQFVRRLPPRLPHFLDNVPRSRLNTIRRILAIEQK